MSSKPLMIPSLLLLSGALTLLGTYSTVESIPSQPIQELYTNVQVQSNPSTYEDYNELKLFFHQTHSTPQTFRWEEETLYQLTSVEQAEPIPQQTTLTYHGTLEHPSLTEEPHHFQLNYHITPTEITESIRQEKPFYKNQSNKTLFSIIPNKVVLKKPFILENEWQEEFIYQEKTYQATSIISDLWLDEWDRPCYKVETHVPTIEGFENNRYQETRIYTEGLGLTYFKNNLPLNTSTASFIEYSLSSQTQPY